MTRDSHWQASVPVSTLGTRAAIRRRVRHEASAKIVERQDRKSNLREHPWSELNDVGLEYHDFGPDVDGTDVSGGELDLRV